MAPLIEAEKLDGRTGFVEKEDEFGFEDYNVGLSSWSKNWEQSM